MTPWHEEKHVGEEAGIERDSSLYCETNAQPFSGSWKEPMQVKETEV